MRKRPSRVSALAAAAPPNVLLRNFIAASKSLVLTIFASKPGTNLLSAPRFPAYAFARAFETDSTSPKPEAATSSAIFCRD